MTPFSYIANKVFVKLKPSKISGVGVFAIRDIPTSTFLFEEWQGETGCYPIKEEELKTLPPELYSHIKDIFLYSPDFPSDTDTYVTLTKGCHWIYTSPYYFVNSGFTKANMDKDTLLSTRNIREGEELLSNYGRYERFPKKSLL